jgi:hypothetical protein
MEGKSEEVDISRMPLEELRRRWAEVWGVEPHVRIGRSMLERSLNFKLRESCGRGMTQEQQKKLDNLVAAYKRNPSSFDPETVNLKPGTRLIKDWNGTRYSVLVLAEGFEYGDRKYRSLSEIASFITGTRRNGWVFFGLKKSGAKRNETT